jgi:V8-like Glu-specific endopeptidase
MNDLLKTRLLARYKRTFGDAGARAIFDNVRAIVGTEHLPDGPERDKALAALEALKNPNADPPTPEQFGILVQMIRMARPAPLVQNGRPGDIRPEFQSLFPDWSHFRDTFQQFASSIGQIQKPNDDGIGTGFLVSAGAIVTNHHVLDDLTAGTDALGPGQAFINFAVEYQSQLYETPVPITKVRAIHKKADLVLLEIQDDPPQTARTPLPVASNLPAVDNPVVTIGYPYDDPVHNPGFTRVIFGTTFGTKHVAPGEVVKVSKANRTLSHDCSTLGGNSGSPVVSMATGEVVGVHFGGRFLWRNEAVDCRVLKEFVESHAG